MREAASFIASQQSLSPGLLSSLASGVSRLFRAWRRRRNQLEVTDLDDQILEDIGVPCRDIHAGADLPFSHGPALELQRIALRNRANWRQR